MIALAVAAIGDLGTRGPFWALPTRFLTGGAAAAGIALINTCASVGGFVGSYTVGFVSDLTDSFAGGLVFLPVGSASYDFYGGDRRGSPLFANSIVALEARTGARRWHFQLVHHHLWDYDPPAQPILADVTRSGTTIPAVIQLTKMGLVFVFNRETGEPVFGVEERAVPASSIDGESAAPTQPFPLKPPPLARIAAIARADLTAVTDDSHRECAAFFDRLLPSGTTMVQANPLRAAAKATLWP